MNASQSLSSSESDQEFKRQEDGKKPMSIEKNQRSSKPQMMKEIRHPILKEPSENQEEEIIREENKPILSAPQIRDVSSSSSPPLSRPRHRSPTGCEESDDGKRVNDIFARCYGWTSSSEDSSDSSSTGESSNRSRRSQTGRKGSSSKKKSDEEDDESIVFTLEDSDECLEQKNKGGRKKSDTGKKRSGKDQSLNCRSKPQKSMVRRR